MGAALLPLIWNVFPVELVETVPVIVGAVEVVDNETPPAGVYVAEAVTAVLVRVADFGTDILPVTNRTPSPVNFKLPVTVAVFSVPVKALACPVMLPFG